MHSLKFVILFALLATGCSSSGARSLSSYRHEGPDRAIEDLPAILPSAELRDGAFAVPNADEWFRVARICHLVGKPFDAAIAAYGESYLISDADPHRPRAYYKLAGTHSWGVYGVLILDERLKITKVTTDPG